LMRRMSSRPAYRKSERRAQLVWSAVFRVKKKRKKDVPTSLERLGLDPKRKSERRAQLVWSKVWREKN